MKKALSAFIAIVIVFSFVPTVLFAQGSSIDDPYYVLNLEDLRIALSGNDYSYISINNQINGFGETDALVIPEGKTLIIDDSDYFPYLLMNISIIIENGATLIIRSGISLGPNRRIQSDGGVITNYGTIVNSLIYLSTSSILNNEHSGSINDRNAIVLESGAAALNLGTIDCYVYYYGDTPPLTEGIDDRHIGQLAEPSFNPTYIDATVSASLPLLIEDSIGLPNDGSILMPTPINETTLQFFRIYSVRLEPGQTISLQRSGHFSPAMYILDSNFNDIRFMGYHFTVPTSQQRDPNGDDIQYSEYIVAVAGYNTYDTGTFTLSIHQPEQTDPISFYDPSAPVSGPGWSWDEDTRTLTLNGITFSGDPDMPQPAILLPADSHIVLADGSQNYIRVSNNTAILGNGNLSISGRGSLTINSGGIGILASSGGLLIDNVTSVRVDASSYAISAGRDITVEDCDELFANAGTDIFNSAGIISTGGVISIIRSNLWVTGNRYGIVTRSGGQPGEPAIYIEESFINATTVEEYGRGPITIDGDGEIVLEQCMLVYPEEASIMNHENSQGVRLGQTFNIYEQPHAPGIIHDMQYAVRSLEISPAYTLDYDANGGTGDSDALSGFYVRGENVTVSEDSFSRDGYVFTGWSTSADGSGDEYEPGGTISITANTTLFAQWRAEYTVQFVDWNGNIISEQSVLSGASATAPTPPEREGYTFVDWDQPFDTVSSHLIIAGIYQLNNIEDDSETTPPDTTDTTEATDAEQEGTDTQSDTTAVPRSGQSSMSEQFAHVCIIIGGALLAGFVLIRKKRMIKARQ